MLGRIAWCSTVIFAMAVYGPAICAQQPGASSEVSSGSPSDAPGAAKFKLPNTVSSPVSVAAAPGAIAGDATSKGPVLSPFPPLPSSPSVTAAASTPAAVLPVMPGSASPSLAVQTPSYPDAPSAPNAVSASNALPPHNSSALPSTALPGSAALSNANTPPPGAERPDGTASPLPNASIASAGVNTASPAPASPAVNLPAGLPTDPSANANDLPPLPSATGMFVPSEAGKALSSASTAPAMPSAVSPFPGVTPDGASGVNAPASAQKSLDIAPLPSAPPSAPLPPLATLPGTSAPAASAVPPSESLPADEKASTAALETLVKPVHRHRRNPAKEASRSASAKLRKGNFYRKEQLPEAVYQKSYDGLNQHLPIAQTEQQYDGLVFVTAQRDDINGLRAILDVGRSMELKDADGDTPLLVAVKHNAVNTTRLLLSRHANFNVADRNGMTPVQLAEQNGNFQIVHAIEAAGGSVSQ